MFRGGFLECGAPKRRLVQRPAEKLRLCPVRGRVARRSHFVLLSLKDVAESLSASRTKSAPDGGGADPRCRAFAENCSRWSLVLSLLKFLAEEDAKDAEKQSA